VRDLALIVPSRGRPQNVERLVDAMEKTCRGDTQLVVGVDRDEDEKTLEAYQALTPSDLVVRDGLRGRLVEWLNVLARSRARSFRYLGHIGDDNVPLSDGWDVRVMESLERQAPVGFCFGDDLDPGRPPGSLSIHIFMTAEVVRRLGYMGPPRLRHMYVDPVWYAWGTATTIDFLPDVVLEHRHYTLGRSPRDASYEASTGLIPADCAAYNEYCRDPAGLNGDIRALGGTPFGATELAEFNHRLNIPEQWPG
jgi:hypothetical protein